MSTLKQFAEEKLAADNYPNDYHTFKSYRCKKCGSTVFDLVVEHHTGSIRGDFKGVVRGTCADCNEVQDLFSFTGPKREPTEIETPGCDCGNSNFSVGYCERIEGASGLSGFFDEGVFVGQCTRCNTNRVIVATD